MSTKIAAALVLLLALSGWALYRQISANGGLQKQIEQRDQQLQEAAKHVDALATEIKARDKQQLQEAAKHVDALATEIKARDKAVILLEAERDDLRTKTAQVRTVIRKVYVQPDVQPWANTVPPSAVVDAVGAGIECLWQPTEGGGNADCGAVAAGRDDGRLPAP